MTRIGKPQIGGFRRFGGSCRQAIRRNIKAAAALAVFFSPPHAALAGPSRPPAGREETAEAAQ